MIGWLSGWLGFDWLLGFGLDFGLISYGFDLISDGFGLAWAWLGLGFGLDFGWIRLDFGLTTALIALTAL